MQAGTPPDPATGGPSSRFVALAASLTTVGSIALCVVLTLAHLPHPAADPYPNVPQIAIAVSGSVVARNDGRTILYSAGGGFCRSYSMSADQSDTQVRLALSYRD